MRGVVFVGSALVVVAACGGLTAPGDLPLEPDDASTGATGSSGTASSSGGFPSSSSGSSGGSHDGGHHDGGGFDSGPPDTGVTTPESSTIDTGTSFGHVCPVDPPGATSCYVPSGVLCEYGNDANPSCDGYYWCIGSWLPSALTPNLCGHGTCPASYGDIVQGEGCPTQGLDCGYAQGQCNCTTLSGDGGESSLHWACSTPPGCPEPRPRLGTPCDQPGLVCDYGSCSGGISQTCSGYGWVETAAPCTP